MTIRIWHSPFHVPKCQNVINFQPMIVKGKESKHQVMWTPLPPTSSTMMGHLSPSTSSIIVLQDWHAHFYMLASPVSEIWNML